VDLCFWAAVRLPVDMLASTLSVLVKVIQQVGVRYRSQVGAHSVLSAVEGTHTYLQKQQVTFVLQQGVASKAKEAT
jgi:hypothetical protein